MNRDLFRALSMSLAVALLAGCALRQAQGNIPPIGANDLGDSFPYHKTFHYTGAEQSFVVPARVTSMKVIARGAAGSDVGAYGNLSGLGGRVYAVIPVTPHERLYIFVGGAGHNYGPRGFGGYNGGGGSFCCGGLAGGGATDIREGDDKLRGRIVVAGGGAGQGAGTRGGGSGGDGGSLTGGSGGDARDYGSGHAGGAFGGTQYDGGSGGKGGKGHGFEAAHGKHGKPGQLGRGGNGGSGGEGESSDNQGGSGGGGGGGYYGGGGGGGGGAGGGAEDGLPGAGGGGGSSYVEPRAKREKMWQGWANATGDGLVVLSWGSH